MVLVFAQYTGFRVAQNQSTPPSLDTRWNFLRFPFQTTHALCCWENGKQLHFSKTFLQQHRARFSRISRIFPNNIIPSNTSPILGRSMNVHPWTLVYPTQPWTRDEHYLKPFLPTILSFGVLGLRIRLKTRHLKNVLRYPPLQKRGSRIMIFSRFFLHNLNFSSGGLRPPDPP